MSVVVEVGHGVGLCAAHAGLHGGAYEPLHGHTFAATLRVQGDVDPDGMVSDFGLLKDALRDAIAPLHHRTLVAAKAPGTVVDSSAGQVRLDDGQKHYELPATDVAMLPIANTTTEAIAAHLLDQIIPTLNGAGLTGVELTLVESPGVSATVRRDLQ